MDFFGEKWSSRACFGATRRRKLTIGGDSKFPTGSARSSRTNMGANSSLPVCTATRCASTHAVGRTREEVALIPSTHPSGRSSGSRDVTVRFRNDIQVASDHAPRDSPRWSAKSTYRRSISRVWNHERFLAKLQREPFTDDDARALSDLGL